MLPTKEEIKAKNLAETIGPVPPNFTEIMENMA